jgi:hypothetical protein
VGKKNVEILVELLREDQPKEYRYHLFIIFMHIFLIFIHILFLYAYFFLYIFLIFYV